MFKLPSEITIAHAETFKQSIMDYVNGNELIEIDDSAVVKVDTIGAQLLLLIVTFIASQNKNIQWQCQSKIIKDSVTNLGISDPILMQYLDE